MAEQQDFARALVRAGDPAAADPPYLFLAWQANTAGARHYRANTLNGLLTQLAAALQVTDATGALVDFQRTHRMRHTKATDLLNAGVPIHVVQRYMGHVSPEMAMYSARTAARHHRPAALGERPQSQHRRQHRHPRPRRASGQRRLGQATAPGGPPRPCPTATCGLPIQQSCPHANGLTCPMFITTAEFLPQHRAQHQQTLQVIIAAEARGQTRLAEMNRAGRRQPAQTSSPH